MHVPLLFYLALNDHSAIPFYQQLLHVVPSLVDTESVLVIQQFKKMLDLIPAAAGEHTGIPFLPKLLLLPLAFVGYIPLVDK